jgi:hypothetical protein
MRFSCCASIKVVAELEGIPRTVTSAATKFMNGEAAADAVLSAGEDVFLSDGCSNTHNITTSSVEIRKSACGNRF